MMDRINIFIREYDGGEKSEFGIYVLHWLIEDCADTFWVLDNGGSVREYKKPRFSWKKQIQKDALGVN